MNPEEQTVAPVLSPQPTRPGVWKRWRVLAGGLLVLVLASGLALWWFSGSNLAPPPLPADVQNVELREALEKLRARVLARPHSAGQWGELAMTLQIHQFYPESDYCYAEAERLDPADPRWPYARGLIALKREPTVSLQFFRLAAAGKTMPEIQLAAWLQLGDILLEQRSVDEAGSMFNQALKRDPGNARAEFGLGLVGVARNDSAAIEYLETARASPFYRKQATAQLAALARSRNDPKAAELDKEVATLPDDPHWPDPFVQQLFQRRVARKSEDTEAEFLERQQSFDAAAAAFLRQIETHPTARAYLGAGLNLERTGQLERALPLLREAAKLDPENYKAHFAVARVLSALVEKEPASARILEWNREIAEQARQTTELKPDLYQAYQFWGKAKKSLGDTAGALPPLRKGVAASPTDFELQVLLAETLIELGMNEDAEKTLENARLLNPNDARVAALSERIRSKKQ